MKKIIYLSIFMIAATISFGCSNVKKTTTTDGFINTSISDAAQKIESGDTFILQFSKTTCRYCKELEAIESLYLLEQEIPIYRVLTNDEESEYDSESDFITKNFSDRKTVLSVYWVKDGEVLNKLPIVDKQNQSYILSERIEDNEAYFSERWGDDK